MGPIFCHFFVLCPILEPKIEIIGQHEIIHFFGGKQNENALPTHHFSLLFKERKGSRMTYIPRVNIKINHVLICVKNVDTGPER